MPGGFLVKADVKNVGLSPPELNFIRCSLGSFDPDELDTLASRLELAAITDPDLAMASDEFPQKGPAFRNEVIYTYYIIQIWRGKIDIPEKCDELFGNWVKEVEGASIDQPEICAKIALNVGAPKADKDEVGFKLATGRILAMASLDRIKRVYRPIVDSVVDEVPVRRLTRIMGKASESCIFSKIGAHPPCWFPSSPTRLISTLFFAHR